MLLQIKAYLAFQLPYPREGLTGYSNGTIRQLGFLDNALVLYGLRHDVPVSIQRISLREARRQLAAQHHFSDFPKHVFFMLYVELETDRFCESSIKAENEGYDPIALLCAQVNSALTYISHQVVIACNIARPGSLNLSKGYMFVGDDYYRDMFGLMSDFNLLWAFGAKVTWPKLKRLKVRSVWDWLNKLDDFRCGVGRTPLGKCLSALSFLFVNHFRQDSPLDDLWIIVALEAIFSSNGSQKDIATKAEAVLGRSPTNLKWVQDLYQERSKLIHGGKALPFSISDGGVSDNYEKSLQERMDLTHASLPCVLAVLQFMCQNGLYELKFATKLA